MKIKYFNKLYTFVFQSRTRKKLPKVEVNITKFKEEMQGVLSKMETKTMMYDYQQTINQLYNMEKIDFVHSEKQREEVEEQMKKEEVLMQKAKEEDLKINSNFFNDYSLEILKNTDVQKLIDLSCKSFVGSTGILFNICY